MNRRKLIGLIASLVAAAIGTFAILQYSKGKPAPVVAPPEPTVTILQVSKNIPKGTPAALLTDYVTPIQVPASTRTPNDAEAISELQDLVANSDMYAGDHLSKLRFSTPTQVVGETASSNGAAGTEVSDPNNGLIGVWMNIDSIRALNGNIVPGKTKVAVFAVFPPGIPGTGGDPTAAVPSNHLLMHHVPILDVWPPIGTVIAPTTTLAPAPGTPTVPPIPPTPVIQVKLGVDAPSAERLIYAIVNGSVYLGEESDASPADAPTKIVERSNVYVATPPVIPKKPVIVSPDASTSAPDATSAGTSAVAPTTTLVGKTTTPTKLKPAAVVPATAVTLVPGTVAKPTPADPLTAAAKTPVVANQ